MRMHHQSVKTKVTFSIIHFVRTVCELIFSILQTHYTQMTLFCLHLRKLFSIEDRRTLSPQKKNALSVLLLLIPTRPFSNICCLVRDCFLGFVNSSSSSSVSSSHLSPTALNPPYWKMANFHKVSMFIGLTNRTSCILQVWKWLEICKCKRTITPHQHFTLGFAGNKLVLFTSRFPYFLETQCPYFEKYRRTSVLPANFRTIRGKYGQVGRCVQTYGSPGRNLPIIVLLPIQLLPPPPPLLASLPSPHPPDMDCVHQV